MATSKKNIKTEVEEMPLNFILKFIKTYESSRDRLNAFLNSAFSLANSNQNELIFKYILCELDGKAEIACAIKEFDNWSSLKDFLKSQFGEGKHYAIGTT